MATRILIPYLRAGLGHLVQAQAIAGELHRVRPDWDIHLMDAAEELHDELLRKNFVELWKVLLKMPAPVTAAMFAIERLAPHLVGALNRGSFRTAVPTAVRWLEQHPTDLVMCTHWATAHLFSLARARTATPKSPPIWYLYGELDTTYSLAACGADRYFSLSEKVSDGLARLGIPRDRIRQVPLVVDPSMVTTEVPRDVLRRGLGVPTDSLTVALSLGGEGIGRTLPFIRAFARSVTGATLIVLTGRNRDLLDKVRRQVKSPSVIALGFQEDLSPIVGAADVLAGKCGTGFAAMAMATGIPLIVTHLGAPNERGNMRFIVQHGHGWYCPHPSAFCRKVTELVQSRRSCAERVSDPCAPRVATDGARAIASLLVESLA